MKFNIRTAEIKVKELRRAMKDFDASLELMSRFMVDEASGERVPPAVAMDVLDEMSLDELNEVQTTFMESFSPNRTSAGR